MAETNESNAGENQSPSRDAEDTQKQSSNTGETKNDTLPQSGDPGRTPGSAEGDEETVDADIREKEAEGKL